jgi:hypothetical protein
MLPIAQIGIMVARVCYVNLAFTYMVANEGVYAGNATFVPPVGDRHCFLVYC